MRYHKLIAGRILAATLLGIFSIALAAGCGSESTGGTNGTGNNDTSRFQAVDGWEGTCIIKIVGTAEQLGDNGCNYKSAISRTATYSGVFTTFGFIPSNSDWKMTEGTLITKINDETFEIGFGCETRSTIIGEETCKVTDRIKGTLNEDSIVLYLDNDGYSLVFPDTDASADFTLYEPDDPDAIFQGPDPNNWTIPGGRVNDIAYPATGLTLKGYRLIKDVLIFPPGGDGVRMDAELTWELYPKVDLTPVETLKK